MEVRKGKFIWLNKKDREAYVKKLKSKINRGYYSSDKVLDNVVDKLCYAFNDQLENY